MNNYESNKLYMIFKLKSDYFLGHRIPRILQRTSLKDSDILKSLMALETYCKIGMSIVWVKSMEAPISLQL